MSKLAKMLATKQPELISIPFYYMFEKNKSGHEVMKILVEEKANKMLESEGDKGKVEVLNTKWKVASWREQNEIIRECQVQNAMTMQTDIDWALYRDRRVKLLLADWDLEHEGHRVEVTEDYIDMLPAEMVAKLYELYEEASQVDSETLGK